MPERNDRTWFVLFRSGINKSVYSGEDVLFPRLFEGGDEKDIAHTHADGVCDLRTAFRELRAGELVALGGDDGW